MTEKPQEDKIPTWMSREKLEDYLKKINGANNIIVTQILVEIFVEYFKHLLQLNEGSDIVIEKGEESITVRYIIFINIFYLTFLNLNLQVEEGLRTIIRKILLYYKKIKSPPYFNLAMGKKGKISVQYIINAIPQNLKEFDWNNIFLALILIQFCSKSKTPGTKIKNFRKDGFSRIFQLFISKYQNLNINTIISELEEFINNNLAFLYDKLDNQKQSQLREVISSLLQQLKENFFTIATLPKASSGRQRHKGAEGEES